MDKVLNFLQRYKIVSISPIGALILTIAPMDTISAISPKLQIAMLIVGGVLLVWGTVAATQFANTNSRLAEEVKTLRHQNNADREKRIFVILAAFKEEFQVELNYQLLKIGREAGFFLQVFCPSYDFSNDSQRISQDLVTKDIERYCGGLVVASQFADDAVEELQSFARKIAMPLVLIDHVPPKTADAQSAIEHATWVTVRDDVGGERAADALSELSSDPKRILVLAGPAKIDRQAAFKRCVLEKWPNCSIHTTTDGSFNRERTETTSTRLLEKAVHDGLPYDVVFCTSDSMTLGCLDALQHIAWGNYAPPQLIGYDGIYETRRLIDRDAGALKRVVVQDPVKIAGLAIRELRNRKAGHPNPGVVWIEPSLYPAG